jgi:hypothetical protein
MARKWHPRGEPTFPDWRSAKPGTRVAHIRSGRTGTVVRPCPTYLVVDWDDVGFGVSRGRTSAPAFDLKRVE